MNELTEASIELAEVLLVSGVKHHVLIVDKCGGLPKGKAVKVVVDLVDVENTEHQFVKRYEPTK